VSLPSTSRPTPAASASRIPDPHGHPPHPQAEASCSTPWWKEGKLRRSPAVNFPRAGDFSAWTPTLR
jgi:hypothetical protein